ncbi:oligosaccharide flippase family protein [Pleionea litopenaei]|uniref:Oligosaccharide flippase family protein n=1 Tax=Pleionea litopenaei TaxID=3070815 RepID=A0AA51RTG9_9GAMM|nr:oligosaccharide flippase family protein [Pleionea sp. HL-JVS1]WMS87287.1 oligosaccharide flippase family protein [Pleionea sp. HL-JVS1]
MSSYKALVKATTIIGLARLVEVLVSLVRVKLSALYLTVSELGVFNQSAILSERLSQFTLLKISDGLTKQVAESNQNEDAGRIISELLKGYLILSFVFTLLSSSLVLLFYSDIARLMFGDTLYTKFVLIALISLPILVLNSIPLSILRGFSDMKSIAKGRVYSCLINALHIIPLIILYGVDGAVVSILVSNLIIFIINMVLVSQYRRKFNLRLKSIILSKVSKDNFRELLSFSIFGMTIGVYIIISEFVCRSIVVSELGIEAIGVYAPVIMLSSMLTGFLIPSVTTFLYSKLCESKNSSDISTLLNHGLRISTLALIPVLFIGVSFKEIYITVLYTSSYLEAGKYLPFHLLGLVFTIWFSVMSQSMASTGRIVQHGFFRFFYLTLDIVVTFVFVNKYGLYGWMLKHMVSPILFSAVYFLYCKANMGFRLKLENVVLMSYLIVVGVVLAVIDDFIVKQSIVFMIASIILVSLTPLLMSQSEKAAIKKMLFIKSNDK